MLGIYHHPSPAELAPYVTSHEVAPTFQNEAIAFVSGYVARSAFWLKLIFPTP